MTITTKKQAQGAIDKAGALDAKVKADKKDLDELKEQLADYYLANPKEKTLKAATYSVSFSKSDVFNPLVPLAVYNALEKYNSQAEFFSIITVGITKLRELLPKKEIETLQGPATGQKFR